MTPRPRTGVRCGAAVFVGPCWYRCLMADMTPAGRAARQLDAAAAELELVWSRNRCLPGRLTVLAGQIREATAILSAAAADSPPAAGPAPRQ
jgi:hypothetical protein